MWKPLYSLRQRGRGHRHEVDAVDGFMTMSSTSSSPGTAHGRKSELLVRIVDQRLFRSVLATGSPLQRRRQMRTEKQGRRSLWLGTAFGGDHILVACWVVLVSCVLSYIQTGSTVQGRQVRVRACHHEGPKHERHRERSPHTPRFSCAPPTCNDTSRAAEDCHIFSDTYQNHSIVSCTILHNCSRQLFTHCFTS